MLVLFFILLLCVFGWAMKVIGIIMMSVLLSGCDLDSIYERAFLKSNFEKYPDLTGMDKRGEAIDCASLGNEYNLYRFEDKLYRFENYLAESKHQLNQCQSEIAQYVDSFCESSAEEVIKTLLDRDVENTYKVDAHLILCADAMKQKVAAYETPFYIPPTENRYIEFPDHGEVISPESIERITYWSTDYVYGLDLHLSEHQLISLKFGNKEKFDSTKSLFIDIVFPETVLSL